MEAPPDYSDATPHDPANGSQEENIKVAVRVRPLTEGQKGPVWRILEDTTIISELEAVNNGSPTKAKPAASRVAPTLPKSQGFASYQSPYASPSRNVTKAGRTYSYTFDHLFGGFVNTARIYGQVVEGIVWSAMEGINGTVFAYGQTASGKTYTMKGLGRRNPGLIPLAVQDVFSYIKQSPEREFLLRVSYLEIYNEVINDLLAPEAINLRIREDSKNRSVWVDGLKEEIVVSPEQVMSIIAGGEAHRHIGATDFNEVSSRSHTIFRMIIESKELYREGTNSNGHSSVRVSVLNLIDLAGSERASESVARRKEGGYINKSLLTLGNVISKLSEKRDGQHIPYRDSKLTRILEPSLAGNARIAIICTISVAADDFEETLNTLKFANRAKQITNKAQINEILDDKALIQKYRNEINELKKKLALAEEAERKYKEIESIQAEKQQVEAHNDLLVKKLQEQESLRAELEEKIRHLTKLILVSTSVEAKGKGIGLKSSAPPLSSKVTRTRSTLETEDNSADEREAAAPTQSSASGSRIALPSAPARPTSAPASSAEIDSLRSELRERDAKLQFLRETIDLLNKNLKVLKDEVSWKDEQLKLMKDQNRAKDDKIDRLLELKGDGAADELELLQNSLAEKFAQNSRTFQQTIAEKNLQIESLSAENRLLHQQLTDARGGLLETLVLLDQYDVVTRRLDEENQRLRSRQTAPSEAPTHKRYDKHDPTAPGDADEPPPADFDDDQAGGDGGGGGGGVEEDEDSDIVTY